MRRSMPTAPILSLTQRWCSRPTSREPTSSGRSLMLESDRQGHFQVEARVEGRFVDFVVDTGASLVVLRETTAAQVGIRLQPRDYTATVVTANGKIMAARQNRTYRGRRHHCL